MGTDARQDVYETILKTAQRRLEQTLPDARGHVRTALVSCGCEPAVSATR